MVVEEEERDGGRSGGVGTEAMVSLPCQKSPGPSEGREVRRGKGNTW